ncbi:DUF1885 family protein [Thermoactinomyces sp. AMNI-1]|uniref:DUF1885 family protein n=1 Tax=Thermoactinomyces mirandus TaxID=2756294 RepID=A0A7W2AQE2_9BACL|nr:DUF1885 family protein [Thermoactinomyces mirandus]
MGKSAFIKLVPGSKQETVTLDDVKALLDSYCDIKSKTGKQLGWDYEEAAFPYDLEKQEQDGVPYLLLKGRKPEQYNYIIMGVSREEESGTPYIQVVLPKNATEGDWAKGNEFSKFIAQHLKGELHLFNGRVMYYNNRK